MARGIKLSPEDASPLITYCKKCGVVLTTGNRAKGYCVPCYRIVFQKRIRTGVENLFIPNIPMKVEKPDVVGHCTICGVPLETGCRCKGMCRNCYASALSKKRTLTLEQRANKNAYKRMRIFMIKNGLWCAKKREKLTNCVACGKELTSWDRVVRKMCHKCYMKDYKVKSAEERKVYRENYIIKNSDLIVKRNAERRWALRLEAISAYGGRCECCGETEPRFLTLDHVNGDGHIERRVRGREQILRLLKRLGWPKANYRILCYNCNLSRGFYGYCPHEKCKDTSNV